MAQERYNYAVGRSKSKPTHQRAVVVLLVIAGVTLLLLARAEHPALGNLRQKLSEMLRPVMSAISQPVTATRKLAVSTGKVLDVAEENNRLRTENETLRHWQSVAQALRAENTSLRALMSYQPLEAASYATARVIGQTPGNFAQTLTINAGSREGVAPMQAVIDAYGLVGRVIEVSPRTARVMLLADIGSRVPVVMAKTRSRAVLSGTGDALLRLSFLADAAPIPLGEAVVTTQEGALIPGGIAIGNVFKKDSSGYLVKPLRPLTQAEYVRVVISRVESPVPKAPPPVAAAPAGAN